MFAIEVVRPHLNKARGNDCILFVDPPNTHCINIPAVFIRSSNIELYYDCYTTAMLSFSNPRAHVIHAPLLRPAQLRLSFGSCLLWSARDGAEDSTASYDG